MRSIVAALFLGAVLLLPTFGNAQVFLRPSPAPGVTAVNTAWLASGEPVFHAGSFYYPTGPDVYFDGYVMNRTGTYEGVPLYADATLEPYSMVFVPIGGNLVRPYERLRAGPLAGTTGSRAPSFPVDPFPGQLIDPLSAPTLVSAPYWPAPPAVDRFGIPMIFGGPPPAIAPAPPAPAAVTPAVATAAPTPASPGGIDSIPAPASNDGIWLEFDGVRYFHAGAAVQLDAARMSPAGDYRGFPVYREAGAGNRILVSSVNDGLLTPYESR